MYLKLYKAISCILCLGRDIYYAKYYGGGGRMAAAKKIRNEEVWGKMKKGKAKGGKALKMHLFGV